MIEVTLELVLVRQQDHNSHLHRSLQETSWDKITLGLPWKNMKPAQKCWDKMNKWNNSRIVLTCVNNNLVNSKNQQLSQCFKTANPRKYSPDQTGRLMSIDWCTNDQKWQTLNIPRVSGLPGTGCLCAVRFFQLRQDELRHRRYTLLGWGG